MVHLLGYSPAGDWSEVEATLHLHSQTIDPADFNPNLNSKSGMTTGLDKLGDNSIFGLSGSHSFVNYRRGWVPTSYLTPADHTSLLRVQIQPPSQQSFSEPDLIDNSNPGFSPEVLSSQEQFDVRFDHTQRFFSPKARSDLPTDNSSDHPLSLYPWYHGSVSRQSGEHLLRSGITGSFLVRASESAPGQLSVTVRHLGRVYHYRISQDNHGSVSFQ